jgi:hypothetical protein
VCDVCVCLQVLYARKPDQRSITYQQAIKAGEEYVRNTQALLLRASIMQHDLIQKPAGGGGGGGGSGGPDRPDRGEGPPGRHGRHRCGALLCCAASCARVCPCVSVEAPLF